MEGASEAEWQLMHPALLAWASSTVWLFGDAGWA